MVNSEYIPDIIVYTKFTIITDIINQSPLNIPIFCQRCGQCCSDVAFPEPHKFKKLLTNRISHILPSTKYNLLLSDPDLIQRVREKPCVFLQDDNRCSIYLERPKLCREWYPRGGSECPAIRQHNEVCQAFLADYDYQIGVREIVYIGKSLINPSYPLVSNLDAITQETLFNYTFPPEEVVKGIQKRLYNLQLTKDQLRIFHAINPLLKRME